eukprot:3981865-Pyramimonas_sp.AAC.1
MSGPSAPCAPRGNGSALSCPTPSRQERAMPGKYQNHDSCDVVTINGTATPWHASRSSTRASSNWFCSNTCSVCTASRPGSPRMYDHERWPGSAFCEYQ